MSIYEGALVVKYEQLLKEAKQEQEDALQTKESSNELAIVLYTSGSTGVPKGNIIFCTFVLIIQECKKYNLTHTCFIVIN